MESSCLLVRGELSRPSGSKYPAYLCVSVGKPFPETHEALVFPYFDRARVKELHRRNDGRFLIRLKGVPRKRISPGSIVIAGGQAVLRSRKGYAVGKRRVPPGVYRARGGLFREHSLPGTVTVASVGSGYRITASVDLPLVPGARYRLTAAEEAENGKKVLPFELVMCLPWEVPQIGRRRVSALLSQIAEEVSLRRISAASLLLTGWAALPLGVTSQEVLDSIGSYSLPDLSLEREETLELEGPIRTRFLVSRAFFVDASRSVEKAVRQLSGAKVEAVAARSALPEELVDAIVVEMEKRSNLVREGGILMPAGDRAGLSPIEKGLLDSLRSQFASAGLIRAGKGADRELLGKLVALKLAVRVGDRYCAADIYDGLVERLLKGRNPGESIALPEAKRILGLPREQVVQLMETLDGEGLLRREGEIHRVVRGPEMRR